MVGAEGSKFPEMIRVNRSIESARKKIAGKYSGDGDRRKLLLLPDEDSGEYVERKKSLCVCLFLILIK